MSSITDPAAPTPVRQKTFTDHSGQDVTIVQAASAPPSPPAEPKVVEIKKDGVAEEKKPDEKVVVVEEKKPEEKKNVVVVEEKKPEKKEEIIVVDKKPEEKKEVVVVEKKSDETKIEEKKAVIVEEKKPEPVVPVVPVAEVKKAADDSATIVTTTVEEKKPVTTTSGDKETTSKSTTTTTVEQKPLSDDTASSTKTTTTTTTTTVVDTFVMSKPIGIFSQYKTPSSTNLILNKDIVTNSVGKTLFKVCPLHPSNIIIRTLSNRADPRQRHQRRHHRRPHPDPTPQVPPLLLVRPPAPPQTNRQENPPGPLPHQAPPGRRLRVLVQQRLLHISEQALLVPRRECLPRQAEERDRGGEGGERRVVEDCGRGGYVDCCCVGDYREDLDWEEFLFLHCDLKLIA